MLTLPAIELKQRTKTLYLSYATAEQLSGWLSAKATAISADVWDKEKRPDGYQRPVNREKVNRIDEFLRGKRGVDPLMPSSIVLNLRTENPRRDVKFRAIERHYPFGTLTIDDRAGDLWEVDGQHRARGLVQAIGKLKALAGYCLPLSIVVGLQKSDEALQFVAINTTQTKVKPDLVLRILWRLDREKYGTASQFLGRQTWKITAVDIVDALNRDASSPYCGAIAPPGGSLKGKIISEGMFVSTLEPLARFEKRFLNAEFVSLWWSAMANTFPEACNRSKALSYHVLKGVGPYVFHKIAPLIALWCEDEYGGYSTRELTKALSRFKHGRFKEGFWLRDGGKASDYSSRAGYNTLAREMIGLFLDLKDLRIPTRGRKLEAATRNLLTLHLFREYSRQQIRSVPERPGAYVLFRFGDKAAYVGMDGRNLRRRLREHLEKGFNMFSFKPVRESVASELERYVWHALVSGRRWNLVNKRHPTGKAGRPCPVCHK